jgi:Tol biopolymer transport system component
MYVALAALAGGVAVGWQAARSPLAARWAGAAPASAAGPVGAASDADGQLRVAPGDAPLVVVDRAGRPQRTIVAERPWAPRFSPDGRRVAYGAFGDGRTSSDLWVTDLEDGTTRRLTDDEADANDPQWSPDGAMVAYSASAPGGKDLFARPLAGGPALVLGVRGGTQYPSDWLRDGSALLVTDDTEHDRRDIVVQPADGSTARPYAATSADESAARVSPDGRWVAYTSDESGRPEVYLDTYPRPGRRVRVSTGGGVHPVWRGDGRELYYWRDGALVAVPLRWAIGRTAPDVGGEAVLFRAPYNVGPNTMYDVSPDGTRFVVVRAP